ncbi:MAG: hypothetical protein BM563_05425 [Bacteroidetes bacterium MedPE-SWsnd-G1]|nr:MAG: hypothetical protein BM563_05425 [Bacteroidetes bacterium MedPE-SWsnd-G1]
MEGFDFNTRQPLDSIFYAPNSNPSLDVNRSISTWVIPDFNTSDYINAPEGATHFKLVLTTSVLSDYEFVVPRKVYEAVNEAENEVHGIAFSPEIPLCGVVGSDTP